MDPLQIVVIEVIITAILSVEVYKLHCVSKDGAVASFIIGVLLAFFGDVGAFFIMSLFVIVSFFATLRDIDKKMAMGLQEGQYGERRWRNVMAVGLPPVIIAIINHFWPMEESLYVVMFLTAVAVAGSDTIASEIGVKDPKAYMITTLKPVEPGINGGVSRLGMISSFIAALIIVLIGWPAMTGGFDILLILPIVFGMFGNILDSLFGAWFENRGWISKFTNNFSTELISAVLAGGVWLLLNSSLT